LEGHKKGASLEVLFKALYIQPFEIGFNVVLDIFGGLTGSMPEECHSSASFFASEGREGLARLLY
jgi:hypothetical protein